MREKSKSNQHFPKTLRTTIKTSDIVVNRFNHLDEDKPDSILSYEKVGKFLAHKKLHHFNKFCNIPLRDKLLFELMPTGCRASEVLKLSIDDISV